MNDLLKQFYDDNLRITLYADDTVLYTAHKNSHESARRLGEGLAILSEWCIRNRLTVNVKKTKHMIVCPPANLSLGPEVKLNGESLDIVHKYNYLGVTIDDDLSFDSFLSEKCNKVNVRVYQLSRLRKFITSNIACLIYKQTILPVCEYADQMVECGPVQQVNKLQTLQDKAVRIIDNREHRHLGADGLHLLFRLNLLKLRRAEHLACSMYRLSKDIFRLEHGRPSVHLRSRNKIKFKIPKRNYEKYLKSPLSRGVVLWDRIPELIQRSTTKVKFKTAIKSLLTDLVRPVLK